MIGDWRASMLRFRTDGTGFIDKRGTEIRATEITGQNDAHDMSLNAGRVFGIPRPAHISQPARRGNSKGNREIKRESGGPGRT